MKHKTMLVIIPRALQVVCRDCGWFESGKDVQVLRQAGRQHERMSIIPTPEEMDAIKGQAR